ncbi:hypothetical protein B2H91_19695 [Clostridium botulinum]|uniref:hypothetical protein n=1 Tax=Clostridium botulinum TaxID=1491 RepID=UPI000A16FE45|nr:hypothetical protein [Clostridium botulinum]AUN16108.1 hypothetical protein B2M06_00170 [Clostridium botulinum]AUN16129.1 hypothetical protein B2M06_00275 [Clostridium botulinum]MBN3399570.1 hypothetical protein [Clostridium botulinum]OSA82890.1 hypothetical protein B2H91_19695 [Clostridium botulinum]
MINQELKEKYFNLKGQFLELKDMLKKSKHDSMGLGISIGGSLAIIRFDDFKMILDKDLQEINLSLYFNSKEVGFLNIVNKYNFKFDFDEVIVDFTEVEERKVS